MILPNGSLNLTNTATASAKPKSVDKKKEKNKKFTVMWKRGKKYK